MYFVGFDTDLLCYLPSKTSVNKRWGGVLIVANSSYVISQLILPHDNIEMVWAELNNQILLFFLLCVYIPPNSITISKLVKYLKFLICFLNVVVVMFW